MSFQFFYHLWVFDWLLYGYIYEVWQRIQPFCRCILSCPVILHLFTHVAPYSKKGSVYWKYMSPLYLLRAHRVNEQAGLRILLSSTEWLETGLCLTLRGSQTLCRSVHILAWYLWHLPDRDEDILETLLSFTSAVIQCHTWSPRGTSFQDP